MDTEQHDTLSEREVKILEAIVRNYILTAAPTGSRFLARQEKFDFSAATIRNVMGDLEARGFLMHPHTSAGRVPTDKGYRFYVDRLMIADVVPQRIQEEIHRALKGAEHADLHMLMEATSRALSKATNQLGIALAPRLAQGVFRHVDIFAIEQGRYLMNLTFDAGFVKTIVIEIATEIQENRLRRACEVINERYYGLMLEEMLRADDVLFGDLERYDLGIIRLFIPSIKKMIAQRRTEVFTEGETNILLKPEFASRDTLGAIVEILEEKGLLMHLFNLDDAPEGRVHISIGGEISHGSFSSFSIVKTRYQVGNLAGCLGIIGPKRMPYPFLVAAVDYTAKALGEMYSKND